MYLIVDSNYPIYRGEIIADLPILEPICVRFFDSLLTVTGGYFPLRDLPNPVLGVEGRDRSRVVPVDCLIIFRSECTLPPLRAFYFALSPSSSATVCRST
jgi:hypothetical protein